MHLACALLAVCIGAAIFAASTLVAAVAIQDYWIHTRCRFQIDRHYIDAALSAVGRTLIYKLRNSLFHFFKNIYPVVTSSMAFSPVRKPRSSIIKSGVWCEGIFAGSMSDGFAPTKK